MRFLFALLLTSVSGALGGAISLIVWTMGWFFFVFRQAQGSHSVGFFYISLAGLPIFATLCGLITAAALSWLKLAVPHKWALVNAMGWAGGFFISEIIGLVGGFIGLAVLVISGMAGFTLMNIAGATMGFLTGLIIAWIIGFISLVVGGALSGVIGSSIMFLPIGRSPF